MSFFNDDMSDISDPDYDPYDDIKNERFFKCKRGHRIGTTRWCCRECWVEQKNLNQEKNERVFNYLFNNHDDDHSNYYYKPPDFDFEFNPLLEYYKILQLIPPKTKEQIRKQYLKLSLKHHPDKNNNSLLSVNKFQEIASAYEKLIL